MNPLCKSLLQRLLAALLLAPASAMAQNLIVNGDFDTGFDGWEFPDSTPTWSPLDADGSTESGSAHGVNLATGRACVLRQCVALPRSGRQVLSVWAYTPPGQGLGNLVLTYTARRHSPDCTGGSFSSGGIYLPGVGDWAYHALSIPVGDDPPGPDTTVEVRLCVDPARQLGFGGHFDRVRLVPDVIFRDGVD